MPRLIGRRRATRTEAPNVSAYADAGMVSRFERAQYIKTGGAAALIRRVQALFARTSQHADPSLTTEQGASSAASPSTYKFSLWTFRYERRAKIADVRQMVVDCPRARKATKKYARESVRGGFTIVIPEKVPARLRKRSQDCADRVQRIVNPKAFSWAWMHHVEGETFLQAVVYRDEVVDAVRMPTAAMERNSDDTDRFVDPANAFSQVDVNSNHEDATFPLALMAHVRWDHVDGERYGESELVAGRRARRILEVLEDAQAVRRMAKAAMRILFNVGSPQKWGRKQDVDAFREYNGFFAGVQDIWDPMRVAQNIYGNGGVTAEVLEGDQKVHEIDDIRYMAEAYFQALPWPIALAGVNAEAVNRDVLEDQRAEALKETRALTEQMVELVRFLMDLDLMLHGMVPEAVPYMVHTSESTIETPSMIVDRVVKLVQCTLGTGPGAVPFPLLTRVKALQLLAEVADIDDVQAMAEEIEEMLGEVQDQQAQQQQEQFQQQMRLRSAGGSNGNGAGANGAGKQLVGAGRNGR